MSIMSTKHAIKVAKFHRDTATSKALKSYWQQVVDSLKAARKNKK